MPTQNHAGNKGEEIIGMKLGIDAMYTRVDTLICMSKQDMKEAVHNDVYLHELKEYTITGKAIEQEGRHTRY